MCKTHPDEARSYVMVTMDIYKYKLRLLPLHWASFKDSNRPMIEALIRSYPASVKMADSYFNRLPIHFACINEPNVEVVRTLLSFFPDGAKKSAWHGRLPIHNASTAGASPEVVRAILDFYPQGAAVADNYGMLPLHLACLKNAAVEVVRILLLYHPEGVQAKTNKGNTPLACANHIVDCENKQAIFKLLEQSGRERATSGNSGSTKKQRFYERLASIRGSSSGRRDKIKSSSGSFVNQGNIEAGEFC